FHAPAAPALYTLSLHDALPISDAAAERAARVREDLRGHARRLRGATRPAPSARRLGAPGGPPGERAPAQRQAAAAGPGLATPDRDRKSTRLNSSHVAISYAVFC